MRTATLLSTPVRRPLPFFLLLVVAGLLAACGGGGTKTGAPATTTTAAPAANGGAASGANGFTAYTQCLRAHGVTTSGPRGSASTSTPASTVPQATMNAARQACASLRPAGGAGGGAGALNSPAAAAYRACLQQHGVTLPTPGSTPAGGTGGGFRNNPAFQAASQACASLRPAAPTTPSTS